MQQLKPGQVHNATFETDFNNVLLLLLLQLVKTDLNNVLLHDAKTNPDDRNYADKYIADAKAWIMHNAYDAKVKAA